MMFSDKKAEKEVSRWVNAINKLITGQVSEIDTSISTESGSVEVIAGAIKDTLDIFKGALVVKSIKNNKIHTKIAKMYVLWYSYFSNKRSNCLLSVLRC